MQKVHTAPIPNSQTKATAQKVNSILFLQALRLLIRGIWIAKTGIRDDSSCTGSNMLAAV